MFSRQRMSFSTNGRGGGFGPSSVQFGQLAPTCYVASIITGECVSVPTTHQPLLDGLVGSANNSFIVEGGICGLNSHNAYIPCGGNTYCSDVYLGVCTGTNALSDPRVNLKYVNWGSRL